MATVVWRCGCCLRFKFSPEELEQRYRSLEIDKMIEKDKQRIKRQVKLLLLGAGESGKSTFLKQMRIIHGVKFEPEVLKEYQQVIYGNIIKGMKVLVDARDKLNIIWQDSERRQEAALVMRVEHDGVDNRTFRHIAPALAKLWADEAIKRAFERRSEFQLSDSVQYFLDNMQRISCADYLPTNQDILHARKATKGISEMVIPIHGIPFLFVDVGGQRSQRQKWFECFESVTSILFLVSSSEFDQVLVEDKKTNRLQESQNIFDAIVNHYVFERVSMILFLNKSDLLQKKLATRETDIRQHFPNYTGDPHDLVQVQTFILSLFTSVKRNAKKQVFHHFTTAVDTEDIKYVFNAVKDTVLHRNLESLMLQ